MKLIVLNNPAGVFTTYTNIQALMDFFRRTGRVNCFSVTAVKGKWSMHIETIDATTIVKQLTDFERKAV